MYVIHKGGTVMSLQEKWEIAVEEFLERCGLTQDYKL